MIGRLGAGASTGLAAAAAAIARDREATVTVEPTVWHVLGYPFEAGSMIAALCACIAVRFYVVQKDYATHRWTLDVPILGISLMFTAAAVIRLRPDPIFALVYGTGLGVLGAGIIAVAKKYVDRGLGALLGGDANAPPAAG